MIGTRIGRYEVLRPLATGGMGEVYLARQEASDAGFGTLVAIKVLLQNLSSNQAFVRMFLDEARTVAKLRHDHIVQIRDIAQHNGQYYMVMELIRGQTLRELIGNTAIKDRPLFSPRLGAQLFADLASALAVVHREGLVHRDISPNNIMLSDDGIAKLIDFGVVRALGTASLTNPGTLKGKFGYMAPEYIKSQDYDHRVDLFSLGIVMWETFTRRRLFQGTNAADQLHQVLDAQIPRLDEVLPDFPRVLADLIACALQRDPQRRIPSAGALADQLGEFARAQPIGGEAPTLRKWLDGRIASQIEERRHDEQLMLALPAGAAGSVARAEIPMGLAASRADDHGSSAYDREVSSARVRAATAAPTVYTGGVTPLPTVYSGTSMRLANGEVVSAIDREVPSAHKRTVVVIAATVAVVLIAFVAVTRSSESERARPVEPAAAPQPRPPQPAPQPAPPPGNVHRERGLAAMEAHDYAKAISEFAEAMRGGADNDLVQLLEFARRLQHEAADRAPHPDARPMASAPPPAAPVLATVTRGVGPAVRVASTTHPEASIGPLPAPEVRPPPAAAVDEPVVDAGEPRPVHVEHELAPSPPPARATSAPPPARVAAATPRVTSDGDAVAGERVVAACNACHTRTGAAPIEGHQLSRVQWERFFATGKHDRYVALGDQLSAIQLSAARAFLRARAYDAPENQGAGIREP